MPPHVHIGQLSLGDRPAGPAAHPPLPERLRWIRPVTTTDRVRAPGRRSSDQVSVIRTGRRSARQGSALPGRGSERRSEPGKWTGTRLLSDGFAQRRGSEGTRRRVNVAAITTARPENQQPKVDRRRPAIADGRRHPRCSRHRRMEITGCAAAVTWYPAVTAMRRINERAARRTSDARLSPHPTPDHCKAETNAAQSSLQCRKPSPRSRHCVPSAPDE